jgi:hypothetical protein
MIGYPLQHTERLPSARHADGVAPRPRRHGTADHAVPNPFTPLPHVLESLQLQRDDIAPVRDWLGGKNVVEYCWQDFIESPETNVVYEVGTFNSGTADDVTVHPESYGWVADNVLYKRGVHTSEAFIQARRSPH